MLVVAIVVVVDVNDDAHIVVVTEVVDIDDEPLRVGGCRSS